MGVPLYGAGWTGVPKVNHGLYQNSTGPSPVPLANGTALCPDLSGNTAGCDTLLTPGLATYSTLANLTANGYSVTFDPTRVAVTLYDPVSGTFYTYDDPTTAFLKMLYVDLKVRGGLGGAYVWALKDDDASGTHGENHGSGARSIRRQSPHRTRVVSNRNAAHRKRIRCAAFVLFLPTRIGMKYQESATEGNSRGHCCRPKSGRNGQRKTSQRKISGAGSTPNRNLGNRIRGVWRIRPPVQRVRAPRMTQMHFWRGFAYRTVRSLRRSVGFHTASAFASCAKFLSLLPPGRYCAGCVRRNAP